MGRTSHSRHRRSLAKYFKGKVLFIDPTLDTKTRSVKIRVETPNPDYLLKPGMFVSAELETEFDDHGRIENQSGQENTSVRFTLEINPAPPPVFVRIARCS